MGKNKNHKGKLTEARQAEIAEAKTGEVAADETASGPGHDPDEIRKHNTKGKDRLFEGREQHDDADKNSEKTRLARDLDRHNHVPEDELSHAERQSMAKRKN